MPTSMGLIQPKLSTGSGLIKSLRDANALLPRRRGHLFTTEGMKTDDIDASPEICQQVAEIHDLPHWRSVIVNGRAASSGKRSPDCTGDYFTVLTRSLTAAFIISMMVILGGLLRFCQEFWSSKAAGNGECSCNSESQVCL
jgi:hypothetical protein